jgi:hypothetical protein
MILSNPIPFAEAEAKARLRGLMPNGLSSEELSRLPAAIREQSVFSAGVVEVGFLQKVRELSGRIASGVARGPGDYMDKPTMRLELKRELQAIGYEPEAEDAGSIKDLRTDMRLNLIIDMQVGFAQGFGQALQQTTEGALLLFPCWEFVRLEPRETPRGYVRVNGNLKELNPHYWLTQWRKAGAPAFAEASARQAGTRMIARKDDGIWTRISRFGVPYGPPDFNSGWGRRQVRRSECERLGVIERGERVQKPSWVNSSQFGKNCQASTESLDKDLVGELVKELGHGFEVRNGVLRRKRV